MALAAGLLAAGLLPGLEAGAQVWSEKGDAGDVFPQTPTTDSAQPDLDSISGCLRYKGGEAEDVDLFRVRVEDFELFRFSVNASGANLDPKIYLFYADGTGIAARDDGVPGNSQSLQPELPVDCVLDDNNNEVCGEYGYGDIAGEGEYLVGITRHDIVPLGPNPGALPTDPCPGPDATAPIDGNCPIFENTSIPPSAPGEGWSFNAIVNPHAGMENQPVAAWDNVTEPGGEGGLILAGEYTASFDGVDFAILDVPAVGPLTDCRLPEPRSSAGVGCAAVLLLGAWRGKRRRERARRGFES